MYLQLVGMYNSVHISLSVSFMSKFLGLINDSYTSIPREYLTILPLSQ